MTEARVPVMLTAVENCPICKGKGIAWRRLFVKTAFGPFSFGENAPQDEGVRMLMLCECVSGSATDYAEAERRVQNKRP